MSRHLYVCRTDVREWSLLQLLSDESFLPLGSGSLINLLAIAVEHLERSMCNLTFTSRLASEILENPDPVDPAELNAALLDKRARRQVPPIVTILLPTGEAHRPAAEMWTMASWASGKLFAAGSAGLVHHSRVGRRVLSWLEHPKSDTTLVGVSLGKKIRAIESGAAGCTEELWIRPSWNCSTLIPGSFAPPNPTPTENRSPTALAIRGKVSARAKATWYNERRLEKSGHTYNEQTRSWQRHPKARPLGNGIFRPK